jgi:hypothetical protein
MAKNKKKIYDALVSIFLLTIIIFPQLTVAATTDSSSGDSSSSSSSSKGWDVASITEFGLPKGTIYDIVSNLLMWLLALLGFVGVIGFVIAGIMYLTSAGDDTKMQTAKKAMMYCIYGIVVGLAGVVIIQAVDTALNATSTTI